MEKENAQEPYPSIEKKKWGPTDTGGGKQVRKKEGLKNRAPKSERGGPGQTMPLLQGERAQMRAKKKRPTGKDQETFPVRSTGGMDQPGSRGSNKIKNPTPPPPPDRENFMTQRSKG